MIEESTTAQETMQHGIKGLIYGESGAGKTSLCGTTLAEQTLILSAENGLLPLKGLNIKVWKIKTVEDLIEAHARLYSARDNWQYRYVHIDSLSEIAEVVLANAKRIVKDPRQAYGELIDKMMMTVREFRDLPGRDVWFYAKAEYDKDEISGIMKWMPSMPGKKLGPQLPYLFDEVFFIGVGTDPTTKAKFRYLLTEADQQHTAKDRSRALAPVEVADLAIITNKMRGQ